MNMSFNTAGNEVFRFLLHQTSFIGKADNSHPQSSTSHVSTTSPTLFGNGPDNSGFDLEHGSSLSVFSNGVVVFFFGSGDIVLD